jgi:predicted Zn finger-like uncharacterized protein
MLVQCPKCKTTYRVSDEVVKGAAPSFRCSRCKHTFELEARPESAIDVSNPGADKSSENPELAFSFEQATRSEPELRGEDSPRETESSRDPKPTALGKTDWQFKEPAGSGADAQPRTGGASRDPQPRADV